MPSMPTNGAGVGLADGSGDGTIDGVFGVGVGAGGRMNWPRAIESFPTGMLAITVFVAASMTEIVLPDVSVTYILVPEDAKLYNQVRAFLHRNFI